MPVFNEFTHLFIKVHTGSINQYTNECYKHTTDIQHQYSPTISKLVASPAEVCGLVEVSGSSVGSLVVAVVERISARKYNRTRVSSMCN